MSVRRIALSIGLVNLALIPLGGLPSCHGAGGLAAQHLFGARSNVATLVLGAAKMLIAVTLGDALFEIVDVFPRSLLGVMLALTGVELALCGHVR